MSFISNLTDILKKPVLTEAEYFARNRNKKIFATTTLPTQEEIKQHESGL